VLNTVAAGRRLAQRQAALQAAATLATALAFLLSGVDAALGALAGGAAMTLGSLLAALKGFSGGVATAGVVLGRLLAALALKWLVVVGGLFLAIGVWRLPALPVLAGAVIAALAMLASMNWLARESTRTP
jgi:F0F1-type ATP synthase assembly protein I